MWSLASKSISQHLDLLLTQQEMTICISDALGSFGERP